MLSGHLNEAWAVYLQSPTLQGLTGFELCTNLSAT